MPCFELKIISPNCMNAPDIKEMARRLQAAGERRWSNIVKGDWAGRGADELSPQSFAVWGGD